MRATRQPPRPVRTVLGVKGAVHRLGDLPLLRAPFLGVVGMAAVAAVLVSAAVGRPDWRRRALTRWLPATALADVVLTVGFRRVTHISDHVPTSFHLWVDLVVFAGAAAVGSGRSLWRLAAVSLAALNAFVQINGHYGYFPTVATALGLPPPEVVTAADFQRETEQRPLAAPPAHGQLAPLDIAPAVSHFKHRAGSVWLPPAYFDARRPSLPVILMLSGAPGSPIAWVRAGFALRTADAYASAHGGVAPVLVFTDQNGSPVGDTECVDGPRGKAETFLTVDFAAFLHSRLHLSPPARETAVIGFSEGGTCALELTLRHPDLFGAFVDMAGDAAPTMGRPARTLRAIYGDDRVQMAEHDPAVLLRARPYPGVQAWFLAGTRDGRHRRIIDNVAEAVRQAHIGTDQSIVRGAHDWQFAARALRQVFPAVADHLLGDAGLRAGRAEQGDAAVGVVHSDLAQFESDVARRRRELDAGWR